MTGWLTEKLRRVRLRAAALLQDGSVADEPEIRGRRTLVADFTLLLLGNGQGKDVEVRLANALINRIALEGNGAARVQELLPAWQRLATRDQSPESGDALRRAARQLLIDQLPQDAWGLVPELARREAPVMNTWTYQNEVMEFDIREGDLVLDVGSGGWPFRRADHLADKFPNHTSHRMEAMVRDGRTFFEVDIENLPFKDKEYDFVFCSHVMEHLDNPGRAMRELCAWLSVVTSRSRRGFPTSCSILRG